MSDRLDAYPLPDYLLRQCRTVTDEDDADEAKRLGLEPLPPDHPANFEESYTVGLGGSGER